MVTPDQLIDNPVHNKRYSPYYGQSPYTINSRTYHPQTTDDPRTSIQSRLGAGFYSIPVGETLDTQNLITTGASDQTQSYVNNIAQSFTPTTNNALTAIDLNVKSLGSSDTIRVDVYTNNAGALGTKIAASSISASSVTTSYQYLKVRFIQAPTLSVGSTYWIVIYGQESSVLSNYAFSKTTAGSGLMTSIDSGETWTAATGSINFKTYLSTPGAIKGQIRWVNKNGLKQSLFAFGDGIYLVNNESTGATTKIASGLSTAAKRVRFKTVYDKCYIVNGVDPLQVWDGTTMTAVPNIGGLTANPANVEIFHDRAWYYNNADPTRLYFSNLYPDLTTIPAVNYQYVPDTASADPITAFKKFQNQLVVFTTNSKYLVLGDSVSTLGLSQSPGGTKGAVSQEAVSLGEKLLYFWSVDGGPYYYDGAQDVSLGNLIQPEVDGINDLPSIDAIVTDLQWRIYYKSKGDPMHRYMLQYDLRYQEWFKDTETYTRSPEVQDLETNLLIEGSSVVGALYYAEAQYSHLGAPIQFKYWTSYKKYASGISLDRIKKFRAILASPDRTINVFIGKDGDFDNTPAMKVIPLVSTGILYDSGALYGDVTSLYGSGSSVSQPKVTISGRSLNTQYRFEKDVVNTPVRLYGYEAIINTGRPR